MSEGSGEGRTVTVKVDKSEELKKLKEDMAKIEADHAKEKAILEKKAAEAEGNKEEVERLKGILDDLAKKEFEDQRGVLRKSVEGSKETLGDDKTQELLDLIDSEDFDAGKLERTKIMMDSLSEAFKIVDKKYETKLKEAGVTEADIEKGKKDKEKDKISTGVVSLLSKLKMRGEGDIWTREFDSWEEMVNGLYNEARTETDAIKKQKLEDAINQLWRIMLKGEAKTYRSTGKYTDLPPMILDEEAKRILKEKGKL